MTSTALSPIPLAEAPTDKRLTVAGLFAGIGGIELGFAAAGHDTRLLCEIDPAAQTVLRHQFKGVDLVSDIRELDDLGAADVVTAGFPCQDLSQAGATLGITGGRSGLVHHVFRLLARSNPRWLLFENVSFMLRLGRGEAMTYLTGELGKLGFHWAYRVLDSQAFGLPQRRQRVYLIASRSEDPRAVLFPFSDAGEPPTPPYAGLANGFYWTEGLRGLGWAVDAVPTLKGGSSLGIPSPPAIWSGDGTIGTPNLRDAERLQGFEAGWTEAAEVLSKGSKGHRWKLVGNAVSVPVASWVASRLTNAVPFDGSSSTPWSATGSWPSAAWGNGGQVHRVDASMWPVQLPRPHLADFLKEPLMPLSVKAAQGFLSRTTRAKLRFPTGLLSALARQVEKASAGNRNEALN